MNVQCPEARRNGRPSVNRVEHTSLDLLRTSLHAYLSKGEWSRYSTSVTLRLHQ